MATHKQHVHLFPQHTWTAEWTHSQRTTDVDKSKQARYFQQAEYGMYTRAALLGLILNEDGF